MSRKQTWQIYYLLQGHIQLNSFRQSVDTSSTIPQYRELNPGLCVIHLSPWFLRESLTVYSRLASNSLSSILLPQSSAYWLFHILSGNSQCVFQRRLLERWQFQREESMFSHWILQAPEEFCAGLLDIKPESKSLHGSQFIFKAATWAKGNHHSNYFSKRNGHMCQRHILLSKASKA